MATVFITGASRGIGLELARQYAARGETVFAACRNPAGARELQALESAHRGRLHIIELDVVDEASIDRSHAAVRAQTAALDILINNAAIYPYDGLGRLDQATLLEALNTNAVGPALIAQRYRDLLSAGSQPKLISISSGNGSLTNGMDTGHYAYCASKAALNMLTRTLALDLRRDGITAVILEPGWVQTDMGGRAASITPQQSAAGLIRVIDSLTRDDAGRFLSWDGSEWPL